MKEKYLIKKNLKEKIKEKMTITEFADKVGVTRSYMSEIVNGKRNNVGKSLAILISKEFNTNVEEIFDIIIE